MVGTLDLEAAAKKAAGNWKRFDSFAWFRESEVEDSDQWTVVYTHNRDSGLLEESNAAAIEKALEQFTEGDDPDVVVEDHNHWAVGFVAGYSIRVFADGNITTAFETYFELLEQIEEYPVLNEDDYSTREYEATLENLESSAWRLKQEFVLPNGWESKVYSWLSDNDCSEVENRDDQGGYPSEEALRSAFLALKFKERS